MFTLIALALGIVIGARFHDKVNPIYDRLLASDIAEKIKERLK